MSAAILNPFVNSAARVSGDRRSCVDVGSYWLVSGRPFCQYLRRAYTSIM